MQLMIGCADRAGAITTLGRGGSDLSATFIGASLGVPEVVVWKDVDGPLPAAACPWRCFSLKHSIRMHAFDTHCNLASVSHTSP